MDIHEITKEVIKQQTAQIDEIFFEMLQTHGITKSKNIEEIKKALKKNQMEVTKDWEEHEDCQVMTIKLCKVIDEKKVHIEKPTLKWED